MRSARDSVRRNAPLRNAPLRIGSPRIGPLRIGSVLLALAVALTIAPAEAAGGLPGSVSGAAKAGPDRPRRPSYVPRVRHVFVINIENKGYDETFGDGSAAPYLAGKLRRKGVLLNYYYGTAHNSLPNYLAQISGQAPNPQTQSDCHTFTRFHRTGRRAPGQAVGTGCVYPRSVRTLPREMTHAGLSWRGYMQQMRQPCTHPRVGRRDPTQVARPGRNYAVKHNPFMYFRSVISRHTYCRRHVMPLRDLRVDLRHRRTTRNLSYITPDLCRDGHDAVCANGQKGGLRQVDRFLKRWVPRILSSPAFKHNGMLVITADESDNAVVDSSACCDEMSGPNVAQAGILGPGGGKIGALVISRFTRHNTWSTTPYNHYSLLASLEEIFRLPKIGMAKVAGLPVFGLDVYNNGWWHRR